MEEEKEIEVYYKFYLPEHQEEFTTFINAEKYKGLLNEIYSRCRHIWKYSEASDETIEFAEEIGDICGDLLW